MANTEFLNLDQFKQEQRGVEIGGKKYSFEKISVGSMIKFYEKLQDTPDEKQFQITLEFFYDKCPEAKAENAFDDLSVEQIMAMMQYLVAGIEEELQTIGNVAPDVKKKLTSQQSSPDSSQPTQDTESKTS